MSANATSPSSVSACTRGASGAATSPSTAWSPPAPRSPTPASRGPTSSTSPAPTRSATATPASSPARRSRRSSAGPACACRRATRRARRARTRCSSARAQILAGFCDVALVIGADTTPKGFFAPVGGERTDDPDWLRFHLLGATNPVYFALVRPPPHGRLRRDRRRLRAGEGEELAVTGSRTRTRGSARRTRSTTCVNEPDRRRSAAPARHLRHVRRRARR